MMKRYVMMMRHAGAMMMALTPAAACAQGAAVTPPAQSPASISTPPVAPPSAWNVDESITPLSGAVSIAAQLPSTNILSNMIGAPERAVLILRCQERMLAAYVSWPQVLQISNTSIMSGGYQTMVLWKLDQGAIAVNFWDRSTQGNAGGKFTTGGATKLIAKLFTAGSWWCA